MRLNKKSLLIFAFLIISIPCFPKKPIFAPVMCTAEIGSQGQQKFTKAIFNTSDATGAFLSYSINLLNALDVKIRMLSEFKNNAKGYSELGFSYKLYSFPVDIAIFLGLHKAIKTGIDATLSLSYMLTGKPNNIILTSGIDFDFEDTPDTKINTFLNIKFKNYIILEYSFGGMGKMLSLGFTNKF